MEIIGTYDPIPKPPDLGVGKPYKDIKLDISRAKYWLGVGAQPSDPAWRLLAMVCENLYPFIFPLNLLRFVTWLVRKRARNGGIRCHIKDSIHIFRKLYYIC